ncbi:alpha/beta hydrolase [soil metagenome]
MTHDPTARPAPEFPAVDRNRTLLERARHHVYKSVGDADLDAYVFPPDGAGGVAEEGLEGARACAVFFFGSKWDNGMVSQFAPQAVYFASRGMVSVVVDYRVAARHPGATPEQAMADARSAFRWVRENAAELGIDPEKVVGVGASAGAHAIVAAAAIKGYDEPDEDANVSGKPNALVLFSPIVDISRRGLGADRFGSPVLARQANPLRHVRKGLPPTIVFHGKSDRVIPSKGIRKFCRKLRWRRVPCQLVEFEGAGHGFFNFNVDARLYEATVTGADRFLSEHGFLSSSVDASATSRLT